MKAKNKLFTTIVTVLLSIAILFGFAFSAQVNRVDSLSTESVRTIDTASINTLTFEETTERLLSQYDSYDCEVQENSGAIVVNAESIIDNGLLNSLDFVSTYDEPVIKKYKTVINPQTLDLTVDISYYQGGELIRSQSELVIPYYNEVTDDYFFDIDGEVVSVSETLFADNIDYCIAGVDDVAYAIVACAAVIVAFPIIEQNVTTIVTTFVTWMGSFWSWLKGLFVTTTVTTTVVTNVLKYEIDIFGRKIKLEEVTEKEKEQPREPKYYYLMAELGDKVLMSVGSITEDEAVETLVNNNKLEIDGKTCYLNTYTFLAAMAESVAAKAALQLGYVGAWYHSAHGETKKGMFFDHYHPGSVEAHGSAHSFYGVPVIRA